MITMNDDTDEYSDDDGIQFGIDAKPLRVKKSYAHRKQKQTNENENYWVCLYCPATYLNPTSLADHYSNVHKLFYTPFVKTKQSRDFAKRRKLSLHNCSTAPIIGNEAADSSLQNFSANKILYLLDNYLGFYNPRRNQFQPIQKLKLKDINKLSHIKVIAGKIDGGQCGKWYSVMEKSSKQTEIENVNQASKVKKYRSTSRANRAAGSFPFEKSDVRHEEDLSASDNCRRKLCANIRHDVFPFTNISSLSSPFSARSSLRERLTEVSVAVTEEKEPPGLVGIPTCQDPNELQIISDRVELSDNSSIGQPEKEEGDGSHLITSAINILIERNRTATHSSELKVDKKPDVIDLTTGSDGESDVHVIQESNDTFCAKGAQPKTNGIQGNILKVGLARLHKITKSICLSKWKQRQSDRFDNNNDGIVNLEQCISGNDLSSHREIDFSSSELSEEISKLLSKEEKDESSSATKLSLNSLSNKLQKENIDGITLKADVRNDRKSEKLKETGVLKDDTSTICIYDKIKLLSHSMNNCLAEPNANEKILGDTKSAEGIPSKEKLKLCSICSYSSNSLSDMVMHKEIHASDVPCSLCSSVFSDQKSLDRHSFHVHSGAGNYECEICSFAFAKEDDKNLHLLKHEGSTPLLVKCVNCSKEFKLRVSLRKHLKDCTASRLSKCKSLRSCNYCEAANLPRCLFDKHCLFHSLVHEYACAVCNYRYPCQLELDIHVVLGHFSPRESGNGQFVCADCGLVFTSSSSLKSHAPLHNRSRPFFCEICLHRFCSPSSLKSHILRKVCVNRFIKSFK